MINHLSYSSISTYQLCPRSWRYRYIDKPRVATSPALVFGSAFHNTIEAAIQGGGPLDTLWAESWTKAQADPRNREIAWGDDTPESLAALGDRMFAAPEIAAQIAAIKPLVVDGNPVIEKRVQMHVPGMPLPLIGYIDVITEDGVPGDFKTSSRKWNAKRAAGELQPLIYLIALNQEGWEYSHDWRFRHYIFTKTKSPAAQTFETKRSLTQMMQVFATIIGVWRSIEAGAFPCNTGTWKCSPKWCEYYDLCQGF